MREEINNDGMTEKETNDVEFKKENFENIVEEDKSIIKEEIIEENVKSDNLDKKGKKRVKEKKNTVVISFFIVILIILIFSVIFALLNINNSKILRGISILEIDVSDLTVEEATKKINDAIEERFNDQNNNLILKESKNETSVTANMFNAKFDVNEAIAKAYNIGRDGNIITNNYAVIFTQLLKKNIEPTLYLDEELLKATIKDINLKLEDAVIENSYYIENKILTIVKGKAGYIIEDEKLKNEIYNQLGNIHNNYQVIEIPVIYKEPDQIDLDKIHNEIYREPKNAYVEKNPTVVHTHVDGVDFAISMEEANNIIKEEKKEYEIPLKITIPEKTLSNLGEEAFPDELASFSTIYDAGNKNRSTNIELATQKVNGTVIMPGEKFSFNTIVGKRTIEAGFKEGTAYIGGKVVPDVGGGICQLSTTIYNAALLANLEIVERSNHLFLTGYVSASRDATVYYGSLDFIFKNTRSYPIKIVATSSNGVCKVKLYGIKEENEYEVVIQSKITSYINYSTVYEEDSSLEEGKEIVEQSGIDGCRSEAYRILKLNGKVVSQTLLSKDTYSAREKIVRRGTKKVVKPVSESVDKPVSEPVSESVGEPVTEKEEDNR